MEEKEGKKKFTSADLIKGRELFRHYDFSQEQVLSWAEQFVQHVGYKLQQPKYIGFVRPALHAKRQIGGTAHEIIAVTRQNIPEALDGLATLLSLKAVAGDAHDYAVLFPPLNEFQFLEFFREDNGRWLREINEHRLMMWMCNPKDETVWCLAGEPKDESFKDFFILSRGGIADLNTFMRGPQIMRDLLAEEEEDSGR